MSVIPAKPKKTGNGEPTAWMIYGDAMIHMAQPSQFIAVAGGTSLAGMISGT